MESRRVTLCLPGETVVLWAVFDPDWYTRIYEDARGLASVEAMRFYLDRGRRLGHSPNPFFDERWYLRCHPDVAEAVRAGTWESGFDHYCREGLAARSPHWLYDEDLYRERYPDLADALLQKTTFPNRYAHYLKHGNREGRIAHLFFNPAYHLSRLSEEAAREASELGPFIHFVHRNCLGAAEVATSPYFDPAWYTKQYPDIADAIGRGEWLSALHHYLCNDEPPGLDPLPWFSEPWYRERNPDIGAALGRAELRNGYDHFLRHGVFELRSPAPSVDLRRYVRAKSFSSAGSRDWPGTRRLRASDRVRGAARPRRRLP